VRGGLANWKYRLPGTGKRFKVEKNNRSRRQGQNGTEKKASGGGHNRPDKETQLPGGLSPVQLGKGAELGKTSKKKRFGGKKAVICEKERKKQEPERRPSRGRKKKPKGVLSDWGRQKQTIHRQKGKDEKNTVCIKKKPGTEWPDSERKSNAKRVPEH